MVGSIIYVSWILIFLKKRRDLDFRRFNVHVKSNNHLFQSISGMLDIRQFGIGRQRLWEWGSLQAKTFDVNKQSMVLNQIVSNGANLIDQLKNLLVTFFGAYAVSYKLCQRTGM